MKKIFLIFIFLQISIIGFSQVDTILVNWHFEKALSFEKSNQTDSAIVYYDKTIMLAKHALGDSAKIIADAYYHKGIAFHGQSLFNKALENFDHSLNIYLYLFGEKNLDVAKLYDKMGLSFFWKDLIDKAFEYYLKSLKIRLDLLCEKNIDIAQSYNNLGSIYNKRGESAKALEYFFMSLKIQLELLDVNNPDVAVTYNNIGNIYFNSNEYNKALEYYTKSLEMRKQLFGEKHLSVSQSYQIIGGTYTCLQEYDIALGYLEKCVELTKQLTGEKSVSVADSYSTIGSVYGNQNQYDKALEYHRRSLDINKALFGEKNTKVSLDYYNIAFLYQNKGEYDTAIQYFSKSLGIDRELLGPKHPYIAWTYNSIGEVYSINKEYEIALKYYHLGVCASLRNYNDTTNIFAVPIMHNYLEYLELLNNLKGKAQCLVGLNKFEIAFRCCQAADTLILQTRKSMTKQSDKIALGVQASQIYEEAILISETLKAGSPKLWDKKKYADLSFYFSEKNKSSVLLEALSGQEAQKFAGIPEDLLQSEHQLTTDIASLTEQLAKLESADSLKISALQKKLFDSNRSYDSLIVVFEKKYPKYHDLKYNVNTASVKDIQNLIDKKTAMLSYFVGDSTVTIYTIAKNSFNIQSIKKPEDLGETVEFFRNSLTNQNKKSDKAYRKYGTSLYEMLVPKNLDKNIGNLVIVPDGVLATIPFETLLTTKVADTTQFQNLPYLVRKYSISYCSSATLFKETFSQSKGSPKEIRPLNDWIAYAPVFDDENSQGTSLASRALIRELHKLNKDSTLTRGLMMGTGESVPSLPGSENEVKNIFNEFDKLNLKTTVELKGNASERSIKSGELENYKYIHLATHGFVNSEKPELSGLLLAQVADSTNEQNDGILYSGEIFNLKLNADLVVLSACETGLGQIKKGEGIIGLTRALLYAGAKNLMVSLWQVSDQSTSDLMISFYKNLLNEKSSTLSNSVRFAPLLQQAKLKMISEVKFAHPFYWSPFILIGQ